MKLKNKLLVLTLGLATFVSATVAGAVEIPTNVLNVGKNGKAIIQPLRVNAGAIVWITPTANDFYRVDEVVVDGGKIEVTNFGDGTYSYIQPSYPVDIDVTFEGDGTGRAEEDQYGYVDENLDQNQDVENSKDENKNNALTNFVDVNAGSWYEEYIAFVVEKGIMQGNSPTEFEPNAITNRGMMITVLYNLAGKPETQNDGVAWYSEAKAWANGVGISDGANLSGELSREQLVTMLYRYAKASGEDVSVKADLTKFRGDSKISEFALDAFKWAVAKGIVNGDAYGNLNPHGVATRGELAKILTTYIGN